MKLYYHFIHLYFLTEFEILFYIFYIMPYEKELILNLVKPPADIPYYNISINQNDCDKYQRRLNRSNDRLWNMCVYYLVAINAILFLLFCRDLLQNYIMFIENFNSRLSPKFNAASSLMSFKSANNLSEHKKNNDTGIELQPLSNCNGTNGEEDMRETSFVVYYWNNSTFFAEFCKTVQFILLVAVFEYLFFKSVVNKYKILDRKTLLCNVVNEL